MFETAGPPRLVKSLLGLCFQFLACGVLVAQTSATAPAPTTAASPAAEASTTEGFITGAAAQAWDKWQAAMQAVLERAQDKAEAALGELLAMEPSPFRIALLADYAVQRTALGGAVLLFEQDMESKALGPNGQKIGDLLVSGREQMNEADDGWYFCQVGRFDVAEANFRALLATDPDPVALLEFTDRIKKRRDVLIQLINNATVGESVRSILKLLDRGETAIKADPTRIKENIERLGGPPRGFENAVQALKDSGEYVPPFIVQYLRDPEQKHLLAPILRCLPLIDRPALNPLVMALRMNDDVTKRYLIEALAKIGYGQAVPYLLQLVTDEKASPEVKAAARAAVDALRTAQAELATDLPVPEAFYQLAQGYYAGKQSLAADVRLDTANIWYWRDDLLQNIPVPTVIFDEIMCMRCCEESLRCDPQMKPAVSLWLAADFRREAQLPPEAQDMTRPPAYPPASYFAQSAGPDYCLAALARALDANEPAVALGAIDALRKTAGPASLVADAAGRLPLAEALKFSDRMVRVQAALTLGLGTPQTTFVGYQNLMPVLSEALMLYGGGRNALVVDPDAESANTVAAALREQGYETLIDANLYPALEKVRGTLPGLDVILVASNIKDPALQPALHKLRAEFRFASVPVVLVAKPGEALVVRELVRGDHRLAEVAVNATPVEIARAVAKVSRAVGVKPITADVGRQLASEAVQVLKLLAVTNNPVFSVADAEALGYLGSGKAQEAIAKIALDAAMPEEMRVKMFTALAEAAKRRGNLLGEESVQKIVTVAGKDENLTIREAASQTLGALNVPGAPASEIIRSQYRG